MKDFFDTFNALYKHREYTAVIMRLSDVDTRSTKIFDVVKQLPFVTKNHQRTKVKNIDLYRFELIHSNQIPTRLPSSNEVTKINDGGTTYFLYDLVVAASDDFVLLAVPFSELAKLYFTKLDTVIRRKYQHHIKHIEYAKVDLRNLVTRMGTDASLPAKSFEQGITLTKFVCTYSTISSQDVSNQTLSISGEKLHKSIQYRLLVNPFFTGDIDKEASEVLQSFPEYDKNALNVAPRSLTISARFLPNYKCVAYFNREGTIKCRVGKNFNSLIAVLESVKELFEYGDIVTHTASVPIRNVSSLDDIEDD